MSLPHMQWRYVGQRSFNTASMGACLDELFALGQSSTYADGTSRTPGSGSAGTWSQVRVLGVTECLHVAPPVNPLNTRIMIAGASYNPSPLPVMQQVNFGWAQNDSWSQNVLMLCMVKNAGAFTTWNAANPFTTGQSTLWGGWFPISNGVGSVLLWEGREAIAVMVTNSVGITSYGFIAGAIIDPETADTSVDAESDGRVYGYIRSGRASAISTAFWNSDANFMNVQDTDGGAHALTFVPGSSATTPIRRFWQGATPVSGTSLRTRSGAFARLAIPYRGRVIDNFIGRLRDAYAFPDAQSPQRQMDGTTVVGYVYSPGIGGAADALLLEHA